MWPFKKRTARSPEPLSDVVPPVDLNKPVENPKLLAAIRAFAQSRSVETQRNLCQTLSDAIFLVATRLTQASIVHDAPEQATAQRTIAVLACSDEFGNSMLPLFTDWNEIRRWPHEGISGMVLPAHDAWQMAERDYHGVVINPGGQSITLTNDMIAQLFGTTPPLEGAEVLRETEHARTMRVTQEMDIQTKVARTVPPEVDDAIRAVCEQEAAIRSCVLLDMRKRDGSDIKLLVNVELTDSSEFDRIAERLATIVQRVPGFQRETYITSDDQYLYYLPDAIFRR